jgi:site-specific DNA-methyltransferase (adenine-specific)
MTVTVHLGDNREVLKHIASASVDAVVTDPPYGLSDPPDAATVRAVLKSWMAGRDYLPPATKGFMGKSWDAFVPGPEVWVECLRVLKPGGHLVAFFGTRTVDLGGLAIRLAGFEMRDLLAWLYGSGFPKALDVSKAIDKGAGDERPVVGAKRKTQSFGANEVYGSGPDKGGLQIVTSAASAAWEGWATALKPALEPIVFARKPLEGTVAANVLKHGTGALNIDGCRVAADGPDINARASKGRGMGYHGDDSERGAWTADAGRWPANVVHDGSDEVVGAFPQSGGAQGRVTGQEPSTGDRYILSGLAGRHAPRETRGDSGSAARFFYSSKADAEDRLGSDHPTVKPIDLMAWLCRLVTPPGGVVLDPFAGSGTTGIAALREGFCAILVERDVRHHADIQLRLEHAAGRGAHSANLKTRNKKARPIEGGLFGEEVA